MPSMSTRFGSADYALFANEPVAPGWRNGPGAVIETRLIVTSSVGLTLARWLLSRGEHFLDGNVEAGK